MSENWTPGPWRVEIYIRRDRDINGHERGEPYISGYDITSDASPIVTCEGILADGEANARLIAAASAGSRGNRRMTPTHEEVERFIEEVSGYFQGPDDCLAGQTTHVAIGYLRALDAERRELRTQALRAERENSEILLKAGADGAVSMMMELQQDCCALRAENQKLYELLKLWCEVPEVTETAPEDREPETDDVWRKTRAALAQSGGE